MHGCKIIAGSTQPGGGRRGRRWRIAAWAIAALILLLPLVTMHVTNQMLWDAADFASAGALIAVLGVTYEMAVRMTYSTTYRIAVGIALAAAFILIWLNLAVGIIGSEDNPANLMYGGVLAVAIIGAIVGRFKPAGMARAMSATALAQALVGVIALAAGFGASAPSFPEAIVFLTGFFAALWLLSAFLFRKAARAQTSAGAVP